jgi:hypothetical protein
MSIKLQLPCNTPLEVSQNAIHIDSSKKGKAKLDTLMVKGYGFEQSYRD